MTDADLTEEFVGAPECTHRSLTQVGRTEIRVTLVLLSVAWIAGWIGASIIYRQTSGKPIFPRAPSNADFSETWRSGRSLKNFLTSIGGARNCLLVYVSQGTLTIVPMFPFNLMFLPEIYGLEITAPVGAVIVGERDGLLGKRMLLSIAGAKEQRLEISLNVPQAFEQAMKGK